VRKEVAAHCGYWASGMPLQEGKRAATTLERWQQVHDLRARNVGLLECARRLSLSLNTVKRYDRASEPERVQRVPKYRATLVDPYRDHLRKRRAEDPGVPVRQLLREIRERGYQGSSNLLVRYINQGRLEGGRPHLSPRRAARILLTRPDRLTGGQHETLAGLQGACPQMTALAGLIRSFAALTPGPGNDARLSQWMTDAQCGPAPRALLHPRPGPGHPGRHSRGHDAAPQRPHRRRQHRDQDDQKAKCTAAQDSSSSATGSCWADTIRHHRKCDRAVVLTVPVRCSPRRALALRGPPGTPRRTSQIAAVMTRSIGHAWWCGRKVASF
jgi:hypothetical protein